MVHIYTGNGKGKTTASLGLILRALGRNWRVCLVQFMKNNSEYGEIRFLKQQNGIDVYQFGGKGFVDPAKPSELDIEQATAAADKAAFAINSGQYQLVVIDEINVAVAWNLLTIERQLALMDLVKKPGSPELVMTGRGADQKAIAKADLVTEMKEIKHYYQAGVDARPGVEY